MPEKQRKKRVRKTMPSYRQRRGCDQAIVTLNDAITKERRDFWLGEFDSPKSRPRYQRWGTATCVEYNGIDQRRELFEAIRR